jgi:Ca2+-binding EF-hand superfamily protein
MIWSRIEDRFKDLSQAFRYFDSNYNNSISFNEWTQSMEAIKLKMSIKDQLECFKFLDREDKGFINYEDFCGLTDTRRRNIDPAAQMIKAFKNLDYSEKK